jgi:hypothetical protein
MCRRWCGSPFATLVWFQRTDVIWRGELASFRSSPIATRTHCACCGSPVGLVYDARDDIALTVGLFDDAALLSPTHHYGVENRLPWTDIGRDLPGRPTKERW